MELGMRFAERNILDAHPEAEALLIDLIFDLEGLDIWMSDESAVFQLGSLDRIKKRLNDVLDLSIRKQLLKHMSVGELVLIIINTKSN
jgi:hypothetical protein